MINVGVIGYGYWGPNMARNLAEVDGFHLLGVSDLRPERRELALNRFPGISTPADYRELLDDPALEAVAIATPVSTHFEIALDALRKGKHVLVEKPLAMTSAQARQLILEAQGLDRVLMVDHTFIYTGAIRKIRELIGRGELGQIYYYDSTRVNLGLFQHDVNVLWDLAVHDLSIMDYVLPAKPCAVSATGMRHVPGQPENIAYMTMFFDDSLIAHIHVNWLAPVKVRRTLIGGSRKMIVYNDLEPSEKVKVYDSGVTVNHTSESVYQMLISYRTGDMWAPQLDITEGLRAEVIHLRECIERGDRPITDGAMGLRVVEILEAASVSVSNRGRLVELSRAGMDE